MTPRYVNNNSISKQLQENARSLDENETAVTVGGRRLRFEEDENEHSVLLLAEAGSGGPALSFGIEKPQAEILRAQLDKLLGPSAEATARIAAATAEGYADGLHDGRQESKP